MSTVNEEGWGRGKTECSGKTQKKTIRDISQ